MEIFIKIVHLKKLYIFFLFLSLHIFFFSTVKVRANAFYIDNIEISEPFEMNFNKNQVIDSGFKKAFYELISTITSSSDKKRISQIKLKEIKGMVETFSIKEEKFINEIYFVNIGVSFNKKKIFSYLSKKNIFPSIPKKKKFLFIPIIINEKKKDLQVFTDNQIFNKWNEQTEDHHLIEYILPTADLEDLNLIKMNYEIIEQYDFKEITNKYFLEYSIIALIFKNEKKIRVLSRITNKDDVNLKNQSFSNIDFENPTHTSEIIKELKTIYEDDWKKNNQINTSIKLPLSIKVDARNIPKIEDFEKILKDNDLVYEFFISKFDKNFVFYQVVFNGSPTVFLKSMNEKNYSLDTQNKIWILK